MKRFYLLIALVVLSGLLFSETVTLNSGNTGVRLLSSDNSSTVLELNVSEFDKDSVRIDGKEYNLIQLAGEPNGLTAGNPQLPEVNQSIVIPAQADAIVKVRRSEYTDIPMVVAPSKGVITRDIDPNTVPYTFSDVYKQDSFFPSSIASVSDPYILRDVRGVVVHFKPFTYNPATQTLRVYTKLVVEISTAGFNQINAKSNELSSYSNDFSSLYRNHFINFTTDRYTTVEDIGSILVIAPTMFHATMQDYVDWKIQKGMQIEMVDLSVAGSTADAIGTYIQTYYNSHPELTFVQLVGDGGQLPTLSQSGGGSDPSFALVDGTDSYPDIFIGRFSAEDVPQLETQIERTVAYERDLDSSATWLNNAMGVASDQGGGSQGDLGESDIVHMNYIRDDLLGYGYSSVDQIYDPGASSSTVSNNLNQGRGFINYVGHGSDTAWSTTGFSNSNVNSLTNDNMLPFIVSVACVNGNFVNLTCFAEAWMRAENGDNPTGAIAIYASSINQSWDSPMNGQDEMTDLLIAEEKTSLGGIYYNGSCEMMDNYGTDGIDMFKTWHIFGDASLMYRSKQPEQITVTHMPTYFLGNANFDVSVAGVTGDNPALVSITDNGVLLGSAYTDSNGAASVALSPVPSAPTTLTVTVTAFNKETYIADVMVMAAAGAYVVVNNLDFATTTDNQFGRTGDLNIEIENVGVDVSGDLNIMITSTDPNITIIQNLASTPSIDAGVVTTITNAFTVQISDSVVDMHNIPIEIMVANATDTWDAEKVLVAHAPAFEIGSYNWTEVTGNGNSMYDQGEVWNIQFLATNNGHAGALNGYTYLNVSNDLVTVIPAVSTDFARVNVGGSAVGSFDVAFSSQLQGPADIEYTFGAISGNYSVDATDNVMVGLTMETFDNDFNTYPYIFTGGDWIIDDNGGHDGASARSLDIGDNNTTAMQVTMDVATNGNITFWKKVSSESNYDYMKFYIDNQLMNQWSGTINWSQETYAVQSGNHTFRWEYYKDGMVSSGDDCIWVDDIVFPIAQEVPGSPIIAIDTTTLAFGTVGVGQESVSPVVISNSGDEVLLGTITTIGEAFMLRDVNDGDVAELNYIVDPGSTFEFNVAFIPQETGNFTEQLAITSDDPTNPLLNILLSGVGQPTSNENDGIAYVTALSGNYPNPFNPETNIAFSLKENGEVTIEIYNILGQKIKTLVNEEMRSGNHTVVWKGKDNNGKKASSGIYFYRMTSDEYTATNKMILMK